MPKWNLRCKAGTGSVTEHRSCLPSKEALTLFYKDGGVMYKDDKRLTLKEALEEVPGTKKGER